MSVIESPNGFRVCTVCGFEQTGGQSEDILACPDCGAISWASRGCEQ